MGCEFPALAQGEPQERKHAVESVIAASENSHQLCLMNIWAMFALVGGRYTATLVTAFPKTLTAGIFRSAFTQK